MLFKVAARIGDTVESLEKKMSYRELIEWSEFFDCENRTHEKLDYYLAQISCTIAQANAAKGKKYCIKDFLIKFKNRVCLSPVDLADRICSMFGIDRRAELNKKRNL